jgi:hypothetical protein
MQTNVEWVLRRTQSIRSAPVRAPSIYAGGNLNDPWVYAAWLRSQPVRSRDALALALRGSSSTNVANPVSGDDDDDCDMVFFQPASWIAYLVARLGSQFHPSCVTQKVSTARRRRRCGAQHPRDRHGTASDDVVVILTGGRVQHHRLRHWDPVERLLADQGS